MLLKTLFSLFCINPVVGFTPHAPILPATSTFNGIINVAFPLIVPAHGSIDVLHSTQENKTASHFSSVALAYITYPIIHYFSDEASQGLFL